MFKDQQLGVLEKWIQTTNEGHRWSLEFERALNSAKNEVTAAFAAKLPAKIHRLMKREADEKLDEDIRLRQSICGCKPRSRNEG
jgi:hypothetical protein